MNKYIGLIIGLIIICALSGCTITGNGFNSIKASGQIVEVNVTVDDFEKIQVESAFDIVVVKGAPASVVIEIDDNFVEYLDVETRGQKLRIGMMNNKSYRNGTFKAIVTMDELVEIDGSGATSTTVEKEIISPESFDIRLSGSSSFNGQIVSESVDVKLSGASKAKGSIEVDRLRIDLSGSSDVVFDGQANTFDADLSGSSSSKTTELTVQRSNVDLGGASDLRLEVIEFIDVKASGSSDVIITGRPEVGRQDSSGSSEIQFK